jgi:Bacterial dnaA protein helix-turn-helix
MTEAELKDHYAKIRRKFYAKRALRKKPKNPETEKWNLLANNKNAPRIEHPVSLFLKPEHDALLPSLSVSVKRFGFGWIKDQTGAPANRLEEIIQAVLNEVNVPRAAMMSQSRTADLVRARNLIWALARQYCSFSYPQLGAKFHRDHTTIMHGAGNGERDPLFAALYERLK